MNDSSARVPMILRQPGRFEGGIVCDTPVNLVDIAPTFLGASGTSISSHIPDGEDMHNILTGKSERDTVFSQLSYSCSIADSCINPAHSHYLRNEDKDQLRAHFSSYMAVSKDWKYIYSAPDNKEFLFDRNSDPLERRNKAGISFVQSEKEKIKVDLINHLKEGGEITGIIGEDWKGFPVVDINDDPDTGLLIQDGYTPWADMELPGEYK